MFSLSLYSSILSYSFHFPTLTFKIKNQSHEHGNILNFEFFYLYTFFLLPFGPFVVVLFKHSKMLHRYQNVINLVIDIMCMYAKLWFIKFNLWNYDYVHVMNFLLWLHTYNKPVDLEMFSYQSGCSTNEILYNPYSYY